MQDTVSDALLAYAEGGYSRGRTQHLPQPDGNGGWELAPPGGKGGLSGLSVLGLAYTLQAGPTVTVEYLYNNQGWDKNIRKKKRSVYLKKYPCHINRLSCMFNKLLGMSVCEYHRLILRPQFLSKPQKAGRKSRGVHLVYLHGNVAYSS